MRRAGIVGAVVLLAVATPSVARAAVVINEIAWMGSAASANDEWIELANTGGERVALDGWTLAAEDGTPSVALSGAIPARGFFLLERTNDDSMPSVPADVVYSGALENGGETLILRDAAGRVADSVAGGANWASVGGDNDTKETAQRFGGANSSGSYWTTAPATPKAQNREMVKAAAAKPPPQPPATLAPQVDSTEPDASAVESKPEERDDSTVSPSPPLLVAEARPGGNGISAWLLALAGVIALGVVGVALAVLGRGTNESLDDTKRIAAEIEIIEV